MLRQLLGIVILDSAGERLAVKYVGRPTVINSGSAGGKSQAALRDSAGLSSGRGSASSFTAKAISLKDFDGQRRFELELMNKAEKLMGRTEVEVVLVGEYVVLVRTVNDVCIFVIGEEDENELIVLEVVNAVSQSLSTLTGSSVSKRTVLENLGNVYLMLDEIFDEGVIMETDPRIITSRVLMQDSAEPPPETTAFNQAISNARENLFRSLLSGAT